MTVNKQTAVRLKEAGYDVPCREYYHPHDGLTESSSPDDFNRSTWAKGYCSAPDLASAADFLRTKGLHVCIAYCRSGWGFFITKIPSGDSISDPLNQEVQFHPDHDTAYSAGIDRALTILKEKQ